MRLTAEKFYTASKIIAIAIFKKAVIRAKISSIPLCAFSIQNFNLHFLENYKISEVTQ
jgi:hypothetical protein